MPQWASPKARKIPPNRVHTKKKPQNHKPSAPSTHQISQNTEIHQEKEPEKRRSSPTVLKVAEMQLFSSKPSSIFILIVLLTTLLPPTVRSDHNVLKLPSDQQENDLCSLDSESNTCPVKCFRPDPVCGVDGVTYWCGCADAHCAGTRVKKFGYCEVGNGGSGPAGQALLLVHIIWLILLGVFVLFGLL